MNEDRQDGNAPPYLPFATFLGGLELLAVGVPPKLDRSTWPSQSGGIQSQLLKACRFFGLTGEGDVSLVTLNEFVEDKDRRPQFMREMLESYYPMVVKLAAVNATTQQLHDAFSEMGVTGQDTRRKAETFFLQAADYAGLPLSKHWPAIKKRGAAKTRRSSSAKRPRAARGSGTTPPAKSSGSAKTIALATGGTLTLSVDVDVMALTPADRKFVFEMIDKLADYEATSK